MKVTLTEEDTLLVEESGVRDKYTCDVSTFMKQNNILREHLPLEINDSREFTSDKSEIYSLTSKGLAYLYLLEIADMNCGDASNHAKEGLVRINELTKKEREENNH